MDMDISIPSIAFVVRYRDVTPKALRSAERSGYGIIVDVQGVDLGEAADSLIGSGAQNILVSPLELDSSGALDRLIEANVATIWLHYHPAFRVEGSEYLLKIQERLPGNVGLIPVTGDWGVLNQITGKKQQFDRIAIKGTESAGVVGTDSVSVLFSTLKARLEGEPVQPKLYIWGGVASPEGAAAFLACGASGIVFESLHWLTDLVSHGEAAKAHLSALRPDHTTQVDVKGINFRIHDKGNGKAGDRIRHIADEVTSSKGDHDTSNLVAKGVLEAARSALESDFSHSQIVFLGPEAAFAKDFTERFGVGSDKAIPRFLKEIHILIDNANRYPNKYAPVGAARELGLRFPIIQGAMSWITDVPEFARVVAEAGGLPTIALGVKPVVKLKQELHTLDELMGDLPYALNVMALHENPHLDEQIALLMERRPPVVVLSAGEPSPAAPLLEKNITVIYVTSDVGLLKLARQTGIEWVVLEGNEAGGHVGDQTTLILAQTALELKRKEPELFKSGRLILAGGIFNRQTAKWAFLLGADAIQIGTAYLATREIVETGALSRLYQRLVLESAPGGTIVSGESIGLRIRALKTPAMETVLQIERSASDRDETALRSRLESISAGSLHLAAKGIDRPANRPADEETCRRKGQFMSGAAAGALSRAGTVKELHLDLAGLSSDVLAKPSPTTRRRPVERIGSKERIAVTGWAMVNALGHSPEEIWGKLTALKSGIVEVPRSRWNHDLFYDPQSGVPEKTYCRVGAFHNLEVTRKLLELPPQDFRTMAESTRLTLYLAQKAITSSGLLDSDLPKERIGVVISQNSGESASTTTDLVVGLSAWDIVQSVKKAAPMTREMESAAVAAIKSGRLSVDDTTLLGRLNCAAAGFICNKYGFMGPGFSVTAACATSQVALFNAVQMIGTGAIDAAVVGGGEERLTPAHFIEFSALGALAGISGYPASPSESSRPFDADRDGMVLGEGGAMLIVERESAARKRGARIYGYISGVGACNSDRGMVESMADHQKLAIGNACRNSGFSPTDIDLIECHATGTIQGDREEILALKSVFPQGKRTVLTSLKSQIGHTLGASGLSSLIRGLMAMKHGLFPPTLNYRTPDPALDLESQGFVVPSQPEAWPEKNGSPRRIMVNSFGFGGANFVVQAEACRDDDDHVLVDPSSKPRTGRPGRISDGLIGVRFLSFTHQRRPWRAGVLSRDAAAARTLINETIGRHDSLEEPISKTLERRGVFLAPADAPSPPLAVVFAGQGTVFPGMGRRLYREFPLIRHWMDEIAGLAGFDILEIMFQDEGRELKNTLWQQPALFCLEYALWRQLAVFGLKPSALAGHSMGELTALCTAGVMTWQDAFRIIGKRAECMDKAAGRSRDPGIMIAADAPLDVLEKMTAQRPNVFITNYNSPRQTVLGGGNKDISELAIELDRLGYRIARLNVSMAFHSPIMKTIRDEMARFIADIDFSAPRIPVLSNTTTLPYPDRPEEIRRIIMDHLEKPVHFMQNTLSLRNDLGIRLFLEIGPKATLCDLISETLSEAKCIHTCDSENEMRTFQKAGAKLFSLGLLPDIEPDPVSPEVVIPREDASIGTVPCREAQIREVVQGQINAFVLESFGKFLKPAILEAVRRKIDPDFSETELDGLLNRVNDTNTPPYPSKTSGPVTVQSAPPAPEAATAPPAEVIGAGETEPLERFIRIIMASTGYDRDEIEPEMDLRRDLAIRSSRLPVIIDAAEKQFGLRIRLKDFIGLRTVREMADRIAELTAGPNPEPAPDSPIPPETHSGLSGKKHKPTRETTKHTAPLTRSVISEIPLDISTINPIRLDPQTPALILAVGEKSPLTAGIDDYLRNRLNAHPVTIELAQDALTSSGRVSELCEKIENTTSLAGLVLVLDGRVANETVPLDSLSAWLTGFFKVFQAFLKFGRKRFCVTVFQQSHASNPMVVAAEGVKGMLLSAAREFESVLFRSVDLDRDASVETALARSFDARREPVQITFNGDRMCTPAAIPDNIRVPEGITPLIDPGDVIVITGGGRGITSHVASALALFGPRIVCLGRTIIDGNQDEPAREIRKNIESLRASGLEVLYYPCDISDADRTAEVICRVIARYGRIDGVIHGAGLIRDAYLIDMTENDFKEVMEIKLSGAINLHLETLNQNIKFFAVLSSMAAFFGNAGQVNYCGANRAMSAFLKTIGRRSGQVKTKAFLLPPIEGAGLADRPEIREMLEMKGLEASWVRVEEAAQYFCRELFLADSNPTEVMLSRAADVTVAERDPDKDRQEIDWGDLSFSAEILPMIHGIRDIDMAWGVLNAVRTVSTSTDLWILDHKPLKFLEDPIFSGVMAVETFMEAARVLNPCITPIGAREIEFLEMMPCPPGLEREIRIDCRTIESGPGFRVCQSAISTNAIDEDSGRAAPRLLNFRGKILMEQRLAPLPDWPVFPVRTEEFDTRALKKSEILKLYQKHSDLTGRYRVLDTLEGAGAGVIAGSMTFETGVDFARFDRVVYQYPVYLLEGLLHLVNFYLFLRDENETRTTIPTRIENLKFSRRPSSGERFRLEARLRSEESHGYTWDAEARDETGSIIMRSAGIEIQIMESGG